MAAAAAAGGDVAAATTGGAAGHATGTASMAPTSMLATLSTSCSRYSSRGGSSRWRPDGSLWYLPEPDDLTIHGTFLLVADGLDRSAGIGFRCVGNA